MLWTLNAMDATEEGADIEISTSTGSPDDTVNSEANPGWIHVSIRDYGHGISLENRQRIFQPYFTTKETGTGLGLFVCRRIMEQALGGSLELMESSSRGTAFTLRLPADAGVDSSLHRPLPVVAISDESVD